MSTEWGSKYNLLGYYKKLEQMVTLTLRMYSRAEWRAHHVVGINQHWDKSQSNLFRDFTICDELNKVRVPQNSTTNQNIQSVGGILQADTEPDFAF